MEPVLYTNLSWMAWNAFLAFLGLVAAIGFYKTKHVALKGLLAVAWLMLVPNTLYVLTDIKHIFYQWYMVEDVSRLILLSQYIVLLSLGVATYIQSMRWFESGFMTDPKLSSSYVLAGLRRRRFALITVLNFLIAFGIVMGRVLRTNSWYVVTQPARVIADAFSVLSSIELMLLVCVFWVVAQGVYLLGLLVHGVIAEQ